ncbi:MAG: SufD family Fe-S cluster assembly protein [Turneriella sp.]|nr:SufD family Fe-S cluster assembly protein [Turneriella sp.]
MAETPAVQEATLELHRIPNGAMPKESKLLVLKDNPHFVLPESTQTTETVAIQVSGKNCAFIVLPETAAKQAWHLKAGCELDCFFLARGFTATTEVHFTLEPQSRLRVFSLLEDCNLNWRVNAELSGDAAAFFYGLTRTAGNAQTKIALVVKHSGCGGTSEQRFFSCASENSVIEFVGRIVVEAGATGTKAHQLHRGLLLSPGARIAAEPILNIFHDDVRCTHGATIGFIDEMALHYLMARGIARAKAEAMLVAAFAGQFAALLPNEVKAFYGIESSDH